MGWCISEDSVTGYVCVGVVIWGRPSHQLCGGYLFKQLMRVGVTFSQKMGVDAKYCFCWATWQRAMKDTSWCDRALFRVTVGFPVSLLSLPLSSHMLSVPLSINIPLQLPFLDHKGAFTRSRFLCPYNLVAIIQLIMWHYNFFCCCCCSMCIWVCWAFKNSL